jgi:hypothetical protein
MSDMVRVEMKQVKAIIDDLSSLTDKPVRQKVVQDLEPNSPIKV